MTKIINALTDRMMKYRDDITDCCGDHCLFAELEGRIDELEFVLNLLVDEDNKRCMKDDKRCMKVIKKQFNRC